MDKPIIGMGLPAKALWKYLFSSFFLLYHSTRIYVLAGALKQA